MRPATRFRPKIKKLGAALGLALTLLGALSCKRSMAPEARAGVRGKVVSTNGRPLAEATVRLLSPDKLSTAIREVSTGRDGTFAVQDLPVGRFLLRAERPGFSPASVPVTLQASDSVTTVLRMASIQLLEGVVQDGQGRPLAQAALFAWPAGGAQVGVVESLSGSDGRFALAGLSPGAWTLMVEAPGFGTLRLERVDLPSRPLVLRLQGEVRTLGGVVVGADGGFVQDARVLLYGPALSTPREAKSTDKGIFLFEGLGFGKFVLRASTGQRVSTPQAVVIDAETGWLPPVKLTLGPGAMLTGRVLDDTGRPLARADVEPVAGPTDEAPITVKTDKDGRFLVGPLVPARYQVWARQTAHAMTAPVEVQVRADKTAPIEIRLPRAVQVLGQAVDETGLPVAGAVVSVGLLNVGTQDLAVLSGSLPLAADAANLPPEALNRQSLLRSTASDANGRFLLPDLPAGSFRLEVSSPTRLPVRRSPLKIEPGRTVDLGRLSLVAGVPTQGRALDEGGAPVAGARIEARPMDGASLAVFSALTGEDGAFKVFLPQGMFTITAHAARRAPEVKDAISVEAGRPPVDLELRLQRADAALNGVVRDPQGRAAASARVLAFPLRSGQATPDAGASGGGSRAPLLAASSTDRSGRFRLTGVPRQPFLVEIRHPAWPARSAVATPGQELYIELPRPGGIEGEVRDRSSGSYVSGYRLEAQGPDGRSAVDVRTQGAGFELRGLLPGRWRIRVFADGYAPAERWIEVPPAARTHEPSVRSFRMELNRALEGNPAPGVRAAVTPGPGG
jgi:large repetitive protein